jgi:hypothetical protein
VQVWRICENEMREISVGEKLGRSVKSDCESSFSDLGLRCRKNIFIVVVVTMQKYKDTGAHAHTHHTLPTGSAPACCIQGRS